MTAGPPPRPWPAAAGRIVAILLLAGAVMSWCRPAGAQDDAAALTVADFEVAAERDAPQACITFSAALLRQTDYRSFLTVEPPTAVTPVLRDRTLCLEGFSHGGRYRLTVKAGLPAAGERTLAVAQQFDIDMAHRQPAVSFRNAGYVLPRVGADGLPLRTVNVDHLRLELFQVTDPGLVRRLANGKPGPLALAGDSGDLLPDHAGTAVWQGEIMTVAAPADSPAVTPFPLNTALAARPPGLYVAVAENAAGAPHPWPERAVQWFLVSDLGLTIFAGGDGLTVFARSIAGAAPRGGVDLQLLAADGAELAQSTTGPDGLARFDPAPWRTGAAAAEPVGPQMLLATAAGGDVAFVDLAAAGPGLAARLGEAAAGQAGWNAFVFVERGIYRPGETARVTTLLRDAAVSAVTGVPVTVRVVRPDGFEIARHILSDAGAGSYRLAYEIPRSADSGPWTVIAQVGDNGLELGRTRFQVENFQPPRLDFDVTGEPPLSSAAAAAGRIVIAGRYLNGQPAANLPGQAAVTLRPAQQAVPRWAGFRFGLEQPMSALQRIDLPGFTTDADGHAAVPLVLPVVPGGAGPVEAVVQVSLIDAGGGTVSRETVVPVGHPPLVIGVKPRFTGNAVPEGAMAGFDIVALDPARDPDGQAIDRAGLSYELFEEAEDDGWLEQQGQWDYRPSAKDRRLTGGRFDVTAAAPAVIEAPVRSGRYRLDVFDPASGVATSVRFAAGWWVSPNPSANPDRVEVAVMRRTYQAGEQAWIHIRPPYAATVLITVADRRIRQTFTREIGPGGAFLQVPVAADWTAGVHVLATAFAAADARHPAAARRATGMAWLAVDPAPHRLTVTLEPPAEARPRHIVELPLRLDVNPGQPAYVTVAAVEEPVLQLTGFPDPDPVGHFLGPRPLAVEVRDVYGPLTGTTPADAAIPGPGPRRLRLSAATLRRGSAVVAMQSAILPVAADGSVRVPLDLPDFRGRLRLMAVAWDGGRVGHAEALLTVRDTLAVELALPRFLVPGDRALVELSVEDQTGPGGDFTVDCVASGALSLADTGSADLHLSTGQRHRRVLAVTADRAGPGAVTVSLRTPDGSTLVRRFELAVRDERMPVFAHAAATLPAGQIAAAPTGMAGGDEPAQESSIRVLTVGPPPDLAMPVLLFQTDPSYGSAERLVSLHLPLLAGGDLPLALGLGRDADAIRARVQRAIDRLSGLQRADGAYGLWSSRAEAEPWVTPYVLDFLGRARDRGWRVADRPYRQGMQWLLGRLDHTPVDPQDLAGRAYGYWVLARARAVDLARVRAFQENFGPELPNDLARAQVAAALALLGDPARARLLLAQRVADRGEIAGLRDFGSDVRDRAAALVALDDSGLLDRDQRAARTRDLAERLAPARVLTASDQEKAWLMLAAQTLAARGGALKLLINGTAAAGPAPLARRVNGEPLRLENQGSEPVIQAVTVIGLAPDPQTPGSDGFTLNRSLFDLTGQPADPARIRQNDLLVVVLDGAAAGAGERHALVIDPLAAGLEIDISRLSQGVRAGALAWLGDLTTPLHVEARDDRYVAAVDLPAGGHFRLAYLVRATTPGDFKLPGPRTDDMVRPTLSFRGVPSRLTVLPAIEPP